MTAYEFLSDDLRSGNAQFDSMNTWTLGMVRLACAFAEAYQVQCEQNRRKAEQACDPEPPAKLLEGK